MSEKEKLSKWLTPLPKKYAIDETVFKKSSFLFGVFIFVISAFGVLFWYGYGGVKENEPIPVIMAEKKPVKILPKDAGGMDVPNQDKGIYDKIDGTDSKENIKLVNPSEEPIDSLLKKNLIESENSYVNTITYNQHWVTNPDFSFMIQLGVYSQNSAAQKLWNKLLNENPAELSGLSLVLKPFFRKNRELYRMRAGYFKNRDEADKICALFRKKKQACIVVKTK